MEKEQLKQLILSDETAKALADQGDDIGCAARCKEIAPKVRGATELTERGLYDKLGAIAAETVLQKLEAYNGANVAVVKRVLSWLKPSNGGLDFSSQETLNFLQLLSVEEVITAEEFEAINSLSLYTDNISANDVSDAYNEIRINGENI